MVAFLTSSPGGSYKIDGNRIACELENSNGFVDNIKKYWKENARCLIVSASPDDYIINDSIKNIFEKSFPMSGLSISDFQIWDNRTDNDMIKDLNEFDAIILAGGHVPTQNAFFKEINLKDRMRGYKGIVIGISAGTMNSAKIVYAQPELEGESEDISYERFISGLGLTDMMIIPHYQYIKDEVLDGKRVMEDIAYPDSMGRQFIALVDGSYIVIKDNNTTLYGEAYLIEDGKLICLTMED